MLLLFRQTESQGGRPVSQRIPRNHGSFGDRSSGSSPHRISLYILVITVIKHMITNQKACVGVTSETILVRTGFRFCPAFVEGKMLRCAGGPIPGPEDRGTLSAVQNMFQHCVEICGVCLVRRVWALQTSILSGRVADICRCPAPEITASFSNINLFIITLIRGSNFRWAVS